MTSVERVTRRMKLATGAIVLAATFAAAAWTVGAVAAAHVQRTRKIADLTPDAGDRLPPLREGEPVAAGASPAGDRPWQRRTRAIIQREIRSGVLRTVTGSAAPRFVQIGELRSGGRPIGGTALLALPVTLRGIRATVPGYVSAPGGYRSQAVGFTAPQLSDLLVDVDLRRIPRGDAPGPLASHAGHGS